MNEKFVKWLVISACVMAGLPWAAVTFAPAEAGMAICFLLFFTVDPLYSVIVGYAAGNDKKCLWQLPVVSAILFVAASWIFFDMGEILFVIYACIYLVMSLGAMLVARMLNRNKFKED